MRKHLKSGRSTPMAARDDSFDDWAGRIIDLMAGVGLISALVGLWFASGYLWEQWG